MTGRYPVEHLDENEDDKVQTEKEMQEKYVILRKRS